MMRYSSGWLWLLGILSLRRHSSTCFTHPFRAVHSSHDCFVNRGSDQLRSTAMAAASLQQQRHVPVQGMTNLRSLGGYATADGTQTVKWGVLYRSDSPASVPAEVAESLLINALHVSHVFDLRDAGEVAHKPYAFPGMCRHPCPIDMSCMNGLLPAGANVNEGPVAVALMAAYYRHMVRREGKTIGAVVKALLELRPSASRAALVHCTAGKDRTGWTVYLLLTLLDVPEVTKRADYHLTDACFVIPKEAYEYEGAAELSAESFHAFWKVSDAYLDAALAEVQALGGMDAYISSHLGLSQDEVRRFRELILE